MYLLVCSFAYWIIVGMFLVFVCVVVDVYNELIVGLDVVTFIF